jgi:hypothetical protein
MIRSVLPLTAGPGAASPLENFYRERGILDRARRFPGCLDSTLWRVLPAISGLAADPASSSPQYTHMVFADWTAPADYRGWVLDPWRSTVAGDLRSLLDLGAGEQIVGALLEPVPDDHV